MAYINGNKPIVTDGLIYALDFGNSRSYLSGSTQATSMAYDQAVTSVSGSPAYDSGLLSFTGTQYIKRNSSLPALDPDGTFTVMVVGQPGAVEGTLLHQDSFNATANPSSSLFGFGLDSGDFSRSYPGLTTSSLQHITYRYSQGTVDTFINGIPVTASQANSTLTTTAVSNALFIGSGSAGFSGSLAQFYVYNRALSADEIYTTYLVSAGRNGLPEIPKPYTQDENVYKYIQTTGITDNDTISAISTFVSGLKSNGLWNKMTAIYPFLTTSTGSQAVNLKDPGVLGLGLTGSFTGSNVGLTPASSTAYVDALPSNIPYPLINSASAHLSLVSYDVPQGNGFLAGNSLPALGGDVIIASGSKVYHAFKTVGTSSFIPLVSSISNVEVMVIAGGGPGRSSDGGGGGAGGLIYSSSFTITPSSAIQVIVGNGGSTGTNGENSTFGTITATGGGKGGENGSLASTGGSGGGAGGYLQNSGSGIPGQGNDGGDNIAAAGYVGAGGGGAGSKGQNAVSNTKGGAGGSGSYYPQFTSLGGSPAGWFAGGGGGCGNGWEDQAGSGGIGGGGTGGVFIAASNGVANTGGGGGGAKPGKAYGNGGSGIVIVGYDISNITAITGSGTGLYLTDSAITGSINNQFTAGITGSGTIGFLTVNRNISSSFSIHKNNISQSISAASSASLPTHIFFNAAGVGGASSLPQPTSISYASIGAGLTDSEVSTYYNLVSQFQTNLKRQNTLLDNYSGAAAAYSLRRIGPSGYFGPAIRVRRDSDNALRDIGFTSDGQLDTVGLLDFVGVTGSGFVQTWYDQSGNGNNASQVTNANQPLVVTSGSIYSEGNKVTPLFLGAQFLTFTNIPPTSNLTYIGVGRKFTSTSQQVFVAGTDILPAYLGVDNINRYIFNSDLEAGSSNIQIASPVGRRVLIGLARGETDQQLYDNGNLVPMSYGPDGRNRNNLSIIGQGGGVYTGRYTNGTIQEVLIYNTDQSSNRTDIESNINSNYKIYGDATASFDPDYQAFITATGITEPTQSAALETLVLDLKSYGLWDKMKAIYPMVTDKNNRFAQSQDFSQTWNAVSASVNVDQTTAPDGTSTADFIGEDPDLGDHYVYQTVENLVSGNEYVLSAYGKFATRQYLALQTNDGAQAWFDLQNGTTGSYTGSSVSITDEGSGWYRCALYFTGSTTGTRNQHIHLAQLDGKFDYIGVLGTGSYLWGAQFENGNLLGPYRKTEGSGFTTGSMLDQMKYNLVNPVDTDAGFRLTFGGNIRTGYDGIRGDNLSSPTTYINTFFNPSIQFTNTSSIHGSIYQTTQLTKSSPYSSIGFGINTDLFGRVLGFDPYSAGTGGVSTAIYGTNKAYHIASRTSYNSNFVARNSIVKGNLTGSQSVDNKYILLGSSNNASSPTGITPLFGDGNTIALATIGDGLTDYEAKALYWIVQKYQTTLGRQVY